MSGRSQAPNSSPDVSGAVARAGPLSLVEHGVSGLLCEPDAERLAAGLLELAGAPLLRRRLAASGLAGARERTWELTLERLAASYERVLEVREPAGPGEVDSRAA